MYLCVLYTFQKLQERQAAFDKRDYAGGDKQKWKGVMVAELMSSEESDSESEELHSYKTPSMAIRLGGRVLHNP